MTLPNTGIKLGEVRVDTDGLEYRFVTDTWVRNTAEILEPLASSASFPTTNVKVGELAVDANTGVKFRYTGSAWELVSSIVGVGSSVTSGEIATGAVTAAKLATDAVETAKIKDLNVTTGKLANDSVTSDKIDPSVIQTAVVTIPTASVLTLNTTPVVLVPAPGVGKFIKVEDVVASIDFATVAYATNVNVEFRYTDGAGEKVTGDLGGMSGFLSATADTAESVGGVEVSTTITENAPIVAVVPMGNPTDGDSDVKVTVSYRIVSL